MLELYGAGGSRWFKCYWMLKELGLEFKEHILNLRQGEQKTPSMLKLNPFGKTPILKDGDFTLFESLAILNYLGEKHPESGLVPHAGTRERALYDQWMAFCVTDLEQPLWRIAKHTFLFPEEWRLPQDVELAKKEFHTLATALNEKLGDQNHLIGTRFTAADIALTYTLHWAARFELLQPYENLQRYMHHHAQRPAFPADLYKG